MKCILSIDGGGIRGIIPALVLAEIERRLQKPVCELFELVVGTSTGGILALGLALPGDDGTPEYSAAALAGLYENHGRDIFARSKVQHVTNFAGIIDELYDKEGIESVLQKYFRDVRMGDSLCRVMTTAYDTFNRETVFMKSWHTTWETVPCAKAARATSAAPTYFEALKLEAGDLERCLVDGGIFINNPAVSAWAEMRNEHAHEELLLLSLGTGELERRYPHADVKDWGRLQWILPLINCMMDGQSDAAHYQMQRMPNTQYRRLQTNLDMGYDDMDNASKTNIEALKHKAQKLIREKSGELDDICRILGQCLEEKKTGD